ncbi:hypothetical protein [Chitinophaga caseinilytica]|uniref:Lipoprotein n=1 Tax=Chitinophaga caseinilytica TaxID=2267521 RepID=A0ABZ2ZET6_9BACT
MSSARRMFGIFCVMAVVAALFSSCASQKLGCPMKITKVQQEQSKHC